MRIPAMIAGSANGNSTRLRIWAEPIPIPRAASSTSADRVEAGQDVPEEDQERVRDERDLDGRDREPGDRHEQLEQREARDRRGAPRRGRTAARTSAAWCAAMPRGNAIAKPTTTAITVSLTCWRSAGWSTSLQLSRTHSGQKRPFSRTQSPASPKSGITGPTATGRSRREPFREAFAERERATRDALAVEDDDGPAAVTSIAERASRRVVVPASAGPPAPSSGSSSSSSSRVSASRLSPRSAPTKSATKSSAGRRGSPRACRTAPAARRDGGSRRGRRRGSPRRCRG